jgi:hypothetical protein
LKKHYHLKVIRIVLEALCQKFIFCVSQNVNEMKKKIAPKRIQMYPKKNIFLPKMYHHNVLSPTTPHHVVMKFPKLSSHLWNVSELNET